MAGVTGQFAQAVRAAAGSGRALRLRGGGSKDFYGRSLEGEVLDTRAHSGIAGTIDLARGPGGGGGPFCPLGRAALGPTPGGGGCEGDGLAAFAAVADGFEAVSSCWLRPLSDAGSRVHPFHVTETTP